MASPRKASISPVSFKEGTRVILREITASLHNSPPLNGVNKSGNETLSKVSPEHEVKVKFAREFADAEILPSKNLTTESSSLSTASSFLSVASTLSSKTSSGICADSNSDLNESTPILEASGLSDIISACSKLRLNDTSLLLGQGADQSFADATFTSATDELNNTIDFPASRGNSPTFKNGPQNLDATFDATNNPEGPDVNLTGESQSFIQSVSNNDADHYTTFNPTESIIPEYATANETFLQQSLITKLSSDQLPEITVELSNTQKTEDRSVNSSVIECRKQEETVSVPILQQSFITKTDQLPEITVELSNTQKTEEGSINSSVIECQKQEEIVPASILQQSFITKTDQLPEITVELSNTQKTEEESTNSSVIECPKQLETVSESISNSPIKIDGEFKIPFPVKNQDPEEKISNQTTAHKTERLNNVLQTIAEQSVDLILSINEPSFVKTQSVLEKTHSVCESTPQVFDPKENSVNDYENSVAVKNTEDTPDLIVQLTPKDIDNTDKDHVNLSVTVKTETGIDSIKENISYIGDRDTLNATEIGLDSTVILDSNYKFSSDPSSSSDNNSTKPSDEPSEKVVERVVNSPLAVQPDNLNLPQDYGEFAPQRQSTSLNCVALKPNLEPELELYRDCEPIEPSQFFDAQGTATDIAGEIEKLKEKTLSLANDTIDNTSVELVDENDRFISASNDLFCDPSNVDFLLSKKERVLSERLRESLYLKFDPLVSNTNMLPQGNGAAPPSNDERNGEKDISVPNNGTPKRNPAIAAIDRLLFYSPMAQTGLQNNEETEKIESTEKNTSNVLPVVDSAMAEELELVKSTVLKLEEQLEKERQNNKILQEEINQLQKRLSREIKDKNKINVVVDEYEKSISRLVAEREKDRKNQDIEKAALVEELQDVKNHLAASEAAFNDVHAKYERLKVVCTTSKNNELALKESIAQNVATIKALENRYEQVKIHAATRLDKANEELDAMCKQHESEVVKLRAMLKKEELKSNSLTEMVEQKVKENKELTKILDEVIARVNPADK